MKDLRLSMDNAKSKEELRQQIEDKNWDALDKGSCQGWRFLLCAKRDHARHCSGILILETQQSRGHHHRVYDFDRKDAQGKLAGLHWENRLMS